MGILKYSVWIIIMSLNNIKELNYVFQSQLPTNIIVNF